MQERVDAAGAIAAWATQAAMGGKGEVADFMPDWDRSKPREEQPVEQMIAFMRSLQAASGGKRRKRRKRKRKG